MSEFFVLLESPQHKSLFGDLINSSFTATSKPTPPQALLSKYQQMKLEARKSPHINQKNMKMEEPCQGAAVLQFSRRET